MLRKDVRFGLTIGGVLVAVLVVYVLVLSRGGSKPTLTDVTLVTSGQPNAAPAPTQSGSPGVTLTETGSAPANPNAAPVNLAAEGNAQASNAAATPGAAASGSTASPDFTTGATPNTATPNNAAAGAATPAAPVTGATASAAAPGQAGDDKWANALATGMLDATDNTPRTGASTGDTSAISFTQTSANADPAPARPQYASAAGASNPAAPSSPANDSSSNPASGNASSSSASSNSASSNSAAANSDSSSNADGSTPGAPTPALAAGSPSAPANDSAASADPATKRTHKIANGETLSSIATAAYGNSRYWKQIAAANPGLNPNVLHPGTVIVLPPIAKAPKSPESADAGSNANGANNANGGAATSVVASSSATPAEAVAAGAYKVQPGDSLYKIAKKLYHDGAMADAIYQLNKDAIGPNPAKLKAGETLKLPAPKNAAR